MANLDDHYDVDERYRAFEDQHSSKNSLSNEYAGHRC